MIDKCLDYNSRQTRWEYTRSVIKGTFGRHDFSLKWTFGEMIFTGAHSALDWGRDQVADAYRGIYRLIDPRTVRPALVLNGSAANMDIADQSVDIICVDPPYYNNVQYAELSDYFYVWQKRTLRELYPDVFSRRLTNKNDEAVANPARDGGTSSIFLACRKRDLVGREPSVWKGFGRTGVLQELREAVRRSLEDFEPLHLNAVDEMVASYGCALKVLSENWPVLAGDVPVTPVHAMREASAVVAQYQLTRLTRGRLGVEDLEPEAGAVLTLFGICGLAPFPFDDALSLSKSLNIRLENKAAGYRSEGRMIGINDERSGRGGAAAGALRRQPDTAGGESGGREPEIRRTAGGAGPGDRRRAAGAGEGRRQPEIRGSPPPPGGGEGDGPARFTAGRAVLRRGIAARIPRQRAERYDLRSRPGPSP
jgi:adenine-specific DNA methylase